MTTINLKRYYPYMTENVMLEVSDEIAAALSMGGRLCDSYKRQKRRNGECSLDTDPGFEADVLRQPMTPDEYIEARETTFALYDALTVLILLLQRILIYFHAIKHLTHRCISKFFIHHRGKGSHIRGVSGVSCKA